LTYHDDYAFRPILCDGFLVLIQGTRTFRIRTRFHRKWRSADLAASDISCALPAGGSWKISLGRLAQN